MNVFIGEPNVGKTNVLEALSLHCPGVWDDVYQALRAHSLRDIFPQQEVSNPVTITTDNVELQVLKAERGIQLHFSENGGPPDMPHCTVEIEGHEFDGLDKIREFDEVPEDYWQFPVCYYLFNPNGPLDAGTWEDSLSPPNGINLATLLGTNKTVRQMAAGFFVNQKYRLTIDRSKNTLAIAHEEDGALVSLPYSAVSETLRRMIFYHLAIDTNAKKVLAFDEPEAHAYPPYTKILAEKMALDDRGNQFFLTTHSPYMLTSLISKTPAEDLNVVLCRMENFETKAYVMSEEQKVQLMEWGMSAFFNFDRLVDDES